MYLNMRWWLKAPVSKILLIILLKLGLKILPQYVYGYECAAMTKIFICISTSKIFQITMKNITAVFLIR